MAYLYELIAEREKQQAKENAIFNSSPVKDTKDSGKYIALMNSMAHTYGNALAFMQNWIINLFPKDLFKTIHVNSKIAHRQIKSTPHEYIKKIKPMIIFRPRIPDHDEDRFLKDTPLIERMTDIYSSWGNTALMDFFHDDKANLSIKYQLNRVVMYVDVSLYFQTLIQQLNYYHYIENAVRIGHPFRLETCFESFLPQQMLKVISDYVHIPVYDENGNTKEFVEYMNQHSGFPITYKLQGSTRSREFYRYYPVSIDAIITDLDKDDGDRVGSTFDQYQITLTVRMEFFTNGFYFIFGENLHQLNLPIVDPSDSTLIPIFTDIHMKEDLNMPVGWTLYNQGSCMLESGDDSINFKQMLNTSILDALSYHDKNGLPIFDFIDIKIRKQGEIIHEGKDYLIDWKNFDIHFMDQNTYFTYHINICLNIEYINDLMKTIYHLK